MVYIKEKRYGLKLSATSLCSLLSRPRGRLLVHPVRRWGALFLVPHWAVVRSVVLVLAAVLLLQLQLADRL